MIIIAASIKLATDCSNIKSLYLSKVTRFDNSYKVPETTQNHRIFLWDATVIKLTDKFAFLLDLTIFPIIAGIKANSLKRHGHNIDR